jgi:regulator of protease activity HflC (stomatin/prohibitin superfamily)
MIEIYLTIAAVCLLIYLGFGLRLFKDTQRGVVYTFGKKTRTIGPGISVIFPIIEELTYVDLKQKSLDLGSLNVSIIDGNVDIKAAAFIKISNPFKSLEIDNLETMIIQSARSAIKVIIGQKNASQIIKNGSEVLKETTNYLNEETTNLGVETLSIKVYDFKVKQNKSQSKKIVTSKKTKREPSPNKIKESKEDLKNVDVDDEFLLG